MDTPAPRADGDLDPARRAAREGRALEARFGGLLEAAPDAMLVVNADGLIVLVNGQAERLFGYSRDELLASPLEGLVPERHRERHSREHALYVERPRHRPMGQHGLALAARRKDGSEFPADISLAPMAMEGGLFTTAAVRDMTERRRLEEAERRSLEAEKLQRYADELARSNRELESFAYAASHDLQEPLRTMASFAQLLADTCGSRLDADGRAYVEIIVAAATRMQALIDGLLAFSRVDTRGRPLSPVDLGRVLESARADLRAPLEEAGATLTWTPLPTVLGDASQLAQVFLNLIGNAVKYARREAAPVVHVTAEPAPEGWVIHVRDNGIGIDPRYFERVFVIFQRLHGRDEYPGHGIGLALCKKIVERHGGRMWVDSEPGRGSTFSFRLPRPEGA